MFKNCWNFSTYWLMSDNFLLNPVITYNDLFVCWYIDFHDDHTLEYFIEYKILCRFPCAFLLTYISNQLRYWDTRQSNPVHVHQLPDRCYALTVKHPLMVVGSADRNLIVFNLQNPQVRFCYFEVLCISVHSLLPILALYVLEEFIAVIISYLSFSLLWK